jgi:hypothetical protein
MLTCRSTDSTMTPGTMSWSCYRTGSTNQLHKRLRMLSDRSSRSTDLPHTTWAATCQPSRTHSQQDMPTASTRSSWTGNSNHCCTSQTLQTDQPRRRSYQPCTRLMMSVPKTHKSIR